MTERLRSETISNTDFKPKKIGEDLGPGKTLLILVIVVGCFAVLCPNVFYPMLFGTPQNHIKPSSIDRTTGCCDVISETDVNTIRIMSELCSTIIKQDQDKEQSGREIVRQCQKAVLETCGIDITAVLQERVILGHTTKQISDEIRSLNGSLCLKYNFGVSPWRLGVPHRVTVNVEPSPSIRQERPSHLRSEMIHPAFRERGRAIPAQQQSPSRPPPRIVEGKPGPIPGMRPTIGGAGKVVPPPKQTTGTMGLIMPIYTTGIVILFTYTVMKVLFKKQQESLYPPVTPDPVFRREVFEANRGHSSSYARDPPSNKLVVNAMSALLDQVDKELSSRLQTSTIIEEDIAANGNLVNQDDQGSVRVLGMETRASCEGNKKWSSPDMPVLQPSPTIHPIQPKEPPHEIYLEGALPPQSNHLLVADSATEAQSSEEDPAVVLAGKMTLSVLSLDSENGTEDFNSDRKTEERSSSNVSEDFEKIDSSEFLKDQLIEDSNGEVNNRPQLDIIENQTDDIVLQTHEDTSSVIVGANEIKNNLEQTTVEDKNEAQSETPYPELNEQVPIEVKEVEEPINDDIAKKIVNCKDCIETKDLSHLIKACLERELDEETNTELDVDSSIEDKTEITENDDGISETFIEDANSNENKEESVTKQQPEPIERNKDNIDANITLTVANESPQQSVEDNIKPDESKDVEIADNSKDDPSNDVGANSSPQGVPHESFDDNSSSEFEKVDENNDNIENDEEGEDEEEEGEDEEEEEEVEYEYEVSDDGEDDDEIQNTDRVDGMDEALSVRMNGKDHEESKDGTTSNDTMAENVISDEEELNDDEEIIEYVTDEEELTEDEAPPNNVNHIDHNPPAVN